ncbi:MAG TPA: oligosaccharide flippase family protein [Niabella sp.]|nr:oligosaccharide flippase family protein [Niabella sp.]
MSWIRYLKKGKRNISQLLKQEFTKNLLAVLTGSGLSFFLTPFITRSYSPESYGTFSITYSLVLVLSVFASLSLPNALVLTKTKEDFYSLVRLSLYLLSAFSLFILCIIFLFKEKVLFFLELELLGNWVFLIPVFLFLVSVYQILSNWNVRLKEFRRSGKIKVLFTVVSKMTAILGSRFFLQHPVIMILAEMIAYTIQNILLFSKSMRAEFREFIRALKK